MTDLEATVSIAQVLLRTWYTAEAKHTRNELANVVRKVTELLSLSDSGDRTLLEADAIRELERRQGE